jgi:CHASE2 domain-containing sensor protein
MFIKDMISKDHLQFLLRHSLITVLAFALISFMAAIALNVSFLNPLSKAISDFNFTDVYYQILQESGDNEYNDDIVLVDLTPLQNRQEIATALQQIEEQHPKVIGVDCVFEGLKEDTLGDIMISNVAAEYQNIVFSCKYLDYTNDSLGYTVAVRSFFAEPLEVEQGFTNMQYSLYGSMARLVSLGRKFNGELQPSFIARVVNHTLDKPLPIEDKDLRINFTPTIFTVISPDSISEYADKIKDKIVLLGTMTDEYDMHMTPMGKMPGVELLAYAGQTLQNRLEVGTFPVWLEVIVSFLMVLLTQILLTKWGDYTSSRKNKYWRNTVSLVFVKTQLLMYWMIFLMYASYLIFNLFQFDIGLGYAMSAMAFLTMASDFYTKAKYMITEK